MSLSLFGRASSILVSQSKSRQGEPFAPGKPKQVLHCKANMIGVSKVPPAWWLALRDIQIVVFWEMRARLIVNSGKMSNQHISVILSCQSFVFVTTRRSTKCHLGVLCFAYIVVCHNNVFPGLNSFYINLPLRVCVCVFLKGGIPFLKQ